MPGGPTATLCFTSEMSATAAGVRARAAHRASGNPVLVVT